MVRSEEYASEEYISEGQHIKSRRQKPGSARDAKIAQDGARDKKPKPEQAKSQTYAIHIETKTIKYCIIMPLDQSSFSKEEWIHLSDRYDYRGQDDRSLLVNIFITFVSASSQLEQTGFSAPDCTITAEIERHTPFHVQRKDSQLLSLSMKQN